MDNLADIFQVERVLERKISSSGIDEMIEVVVLQKGKEIKSILDRAPSRRIMGRYR